MITPAARKWLFVLGTAALFFILPRPAAVSPEAWQLLAIFLATIVGLVVQPIPGGAIVFLAVCTVAATGLATVPQALAGYADPVVWLVLAAFFISRAMIKTGLGRRIALHFIRVLGKTSLGLGYALASTELLLGMVIPSTGARSGGIIFPIGKSLAEAYDSRPGESARRLGSFLMLMLYQSNIVVCALFLTGQASNPLIAGFARDTTGIELTYVSWLTGAIVPGLIAFLLVPQLIYRIHTPQIRHTPAAKDFALRELDAAGPPTRYEKIMGAVFVLVLVLWLTKSFHPIDYTAVALIGVSLLLLTGVLVWEDILTERPAWDVFIWYGGLLQLAKLLSESGVPKWFAGYVSGAMSGIEWWLALIILALVYFYAHYAFASITAHATAMYVPFVVVSIAAGAPPLFTVLLLAYLSNLSASLTHYGTTPAPIYFGAGYTTQREWWRVGLLASILHIVVWGTLGPLWWKLLGWW